MVEILKILLTAGLSGAFAWWITVRSFEKQKQSTYLEEQLSKFYGPVYFKIMTLAEMGEVVKKQVKKTYDESKLEEPSPEENEKHAWHRDITVYMERKYLINYVEEIVANIYSFGHLVDEEELRKELLSFLEFSVSYDFRLLAREKNVPFEGEVVFPPTMLEKLEKALDAKRKLYSELIKKKTIWPFQFWKAN